MKRQARATSCEQRATNNATIYFSLSFFIRLFHRSLKFFSFYYFYEKRKTCLSAPLADDNDWSWPFGWSRPPKKIHIKWCLECDVLSILPCSFKNLNVRIGSSSFILLTSSNSPYNNISKAENNRTKERETIIIFPHIEIIIILFYFIFSLLLVAVNYC